MTGIRLAVAFLTRLPGGLHPSAPSELGRGVPWFPLVGAIVGILVAALYAAAGELVTGFVAATIAVLGGILVTGAFHEDGLADTFDGLGGSSPERRLEIMRDSRIGTFGAAALLGSILIRISTIASLTVAQATLVIPLAYGFGRAAAVGVMLTRRAARSDGLGLDYTAHLPRRACLGAVVLAVVAVAAAGPRAVVVAVAGLAVAALCGLWFAKKFDGITGDVLGAVEQLVEATVLIGFVAIAPEGLW